MSKHDHKRNPLAEDGPAPDVRNPDIGGPVFSRVATLHDPLTTGLLAEVSRRMETLDFDDETIEEAKRTEPTVDARAIKR
jgi:hypothetical protein